VATFIVSEAIGWSFVPPTVYRQDGPAGPGSLQLFIDHDPEYHYFNFTKDDHERLRPVVLFDVMINNADRKGGHIIIDSQNKLWLIDHGLCFHADPKLRTVIWEFADEPIPESSIQDLKRFLLVMLPGSTLETTLTTHLSRHEVTSLRERTEQLLSRLRFPLPPENVRSYPWPPV
jgi:uncharacterized repeat protein (TIGR03843 family)